MNHTLIAIISLFTLTLFSALPPGYGYVVAPTNTTIDGLISQSTNPVYHETSDTYSALTTTVVVTPFTEIYRVWVTNSTTLAFDLTAIDTNKTAKWEFWLNYDTTNAITITWPSNLNWGYQTPDLTVTGLYKFDCSMIGDVSIDVKQIYPIVNPEYRIPYVGGLASGGSILAFPVSYNMLGNTATTNVFWFKPPSVYKNYILSMEYLASDAASATNPISVFGGYWVNGYAGGIVPITLSRVFCNDGVRRKTITAFIPIQNSVIPSGALRTNFGYSPFVRLGVYWTRDTATAGDVILNSFYIREANILEIEAYNAGWRP